MPRSNQLKDVNAGVRSGVHRLVDCMFCDKKHMRSDYYAEHVLSHKKKTSALDAEAFIGERDDLTVVSAPFGSIICKFILHHDEMRYPHGTCWSCNKYLVNPNKDSTTAFEEHVCKDKAKKPAASEQLKTVKEPIVEDKRSIFERLEKDFLFHASKKGLLQAPAQATGSDLLATIKADKDLAYLFEDDENDDEMTDSILSALKSIPTADAKWRRKLEQTEAKYEAEIQKMTMEMGELSSKFLTVQENYLSANKDVFTLQEQVRQQDEKIRKHLAHIPPPVVHTNTDELDALRKQVADATAEIATLTQKLADVPVSEPATYSANSSYTAQDDLAICRMALSDTRRERDGLIKELEETMEEFNAYKEKVKSKKPDTIKHVNGFKPM